MIKARIEYNGNEYEGEVARLKLIYVVIDGEKIVHYNGEIKDGELISIEFDNIAEEDIEIYNDAICELKEPEKTIKRYWRYRTADGNIPSSTNDGGVYICPVCSYETKQMSSYCPRCGTEFNIEWGVATAEL